MGCYFGVFARHLSRRTDGSPKERADFRAISGLFQGKFGVILGVNRHRSMGFLFIPADGKISRIYPARHLSCRTDGSLKGGVKI